MDTRQERREWFAQTRPWDRIAPAVIDAILDGITDKVLLESFVLTSVEKGLVARYEPLGRESSYEVICAQISDILCQFGNREIVSLVKALEAKQLDAAGYIAFSVANAFESAIALAKNQIAGYVGMAALSVLKGDKAECHDYAELGLSELEKMKQDPAAQALRDSTIFPPDILDQAERQLRSYLGQPRRASGL